MPVAEEISSPELILVSPPELAAQAREALPDVEREWDELVARLRAEEAAAAIVPEPRVSRAAFAFTAAAAINCLAPLVLLIVFRS